MVEVIRTDPVPMLFRPVDADVTLGLPGVLREVEARSETPVNLASPPPTEATGKNVLMAPEPASV